MAGRELTTAAFKEGLEDIVAATPSICFIDGIQGRLIYRGYYMLRLPIDLFTPVFAISRISGWAAHILEQYAHNRLFRPLAEYTGPIDLHNEAINKRS